MKLSEILTARGFVYQHTGESLGAITDKEKRTLYLGVDPTADSLHVGNLAVYMMLRHFAADGHKIILLIGGGTGLIGDPKAAGERPLADEKEVALHAEKIRGQVARLVDSEVEIVNNIEWLSELKLLEFLRDIGKHFTVNALVKKEIMAERLEHEIPLSYTEFAYPLLQAYDYMHLFETKGITLQIGGSDQWTNITAGVELIRKKLGKEAHALTTPLVIDKKTGKKFGKSEGNAVWLDPAMTTPFSFYQFWLNVDDDNVGDYLPRFTEMPMKEIEQLMREHEHTPEERKAQRALAYAATEIVHGKPQADAAVRTAELLFGKNTPDSITDVEREMLLANIAATPAKVGDALVDVLVASNLAASKREAREFIESGAVTVHGKKVKEANYKLAEEDFVKGVSLLWRGKRNVAVLTWSYTIDN